MNNSNVNNNVHTTPIHNSVAQSSYSQATKINTENHLNEFRETNSD